MAGDSTLQPDDQRRLASKNRAVALVLLGLAALMFAITVIRMSGG